ncbi:MAG: hypothetical protein ONB05_11630 [candidate division KSB1 bacterium]|nr:hypothetical protein [candidate division KSB1 bacterium]
MWKFIFLVLLSYWLNSTMDAIDHGKGAEDLRFLWHLLKWGLFWPCWFLAGVHFVLPHAWGALWQRIKNNWTWLLPFWLISHLVWKGNYWLLRTIFSKYGLPDWF